MGKGYRIYKTRDFIGKTEEGKMNLTRSLDIVRELAEAAHFHQDHNLLIDVRDTTGILDANEIFQVVLEFGRYRNIFRNKIAVLMPIDEERLEKAKLMHKALDNENFSFNYFVRFEDAIDWLSIVVDFP